MMKPRNLLFAFLILLFNTNFSLANDSNVNFHAVKAKKGDGVLNLLRRYKLHQFQCNVKAFYQINQMHEGDLLFNGKLYKLPVYIYTYDGKSIRSTIGVNDWEKAVRIQEYNENLQANGIRKSHYTSSKILWVPFHEINCEELTPEAISQKEEEPVDKSTTIFPGKTSNHLFGSDYSAYQVVDHSLAGKVFYILSGHGGPDPGTMCSDCQHTLCEDEYAYDVSLRLARNLLQHGATVEIVIQDKNDGIRDDKILRCDKDERLITGDKIPFNHVSRLKQRTDYINQQYRKHRSQGRNDQVVISIHVDSNSKSHRQDVFFCHYRGSKASRKLAEQLRDTFEEKYAKHQKNRGYKGHLDARGFYVLRNTLPPAVLIELANIQNRNDHRRILLKDNRQALANWIFEGLTKNLKERSDQIIASS